MKIDLELALTKAALLLLAIVLALLVTKIIGKYFSNKG